MVWTLAAPAFACDYDFPGTPELVDAHDAVLVGEVLVVGPTAADGDSEVTLAVREAWKGVETDELTVRWWTGPNETSCDQTLPEVGAAYLLFVTDGRVDPFWTIDVTLEVPEAFACPLGRGDSATGWHYVDEVTLRDAERCRGCATVPAPAGLAASVALALLARRRTELQPRLSETVAGRRAPG